VRVESHYLSPHVLLWLAKCIIHFIFFIFIGFVINLKGKYMK